MVEPETRFKLEAPGGPVEIKANCKNGRVLEVTMTALPSFVAAENIKVYQMFILMHIKILLIDWLFYCERFINQPIITGGGAKI